jgi:hypothetical protein
MKKLTAIAIAPLFAGFLFAQAEQSAQRETKTETTTTTQNTWNGTLVDASCRTTNTAHREATETSKVDENTTKTTKTTSDTSRVECPVTTTTSTFGIMTSDGKYIAFDDPSNMKVVQVLKSNKDWSKNLEEHKPVSVRVMGNQKGDVIVVESIK